VTVLEVQFYPDDLFALDFGHIDLFTANNAEQEVSQPILEWIQGH
jgi:hypothetical protein